MTTMADVHTLSGAYALHALGPEESEEFRQHLTGCSACCEEVKELRRVAARMGAAEGVQPPAELRARILAAVDRTPQLPPVPQSGGTSATPLASPARRATPGRGRWNRLTLAAAAALLVGGGAIGLGQVLDSGEDGELTAAEQVFGADDAVEVTATTMNGGKLLVAVSPSRDEMAVDTSQLPELDDGRVYQLWAVEPDDTVESVGLIEQPGETAAMALPDEGVKVALTIEPAGGSTRPTKAPIAEVDPAAV